MGRARESGALEVSLVDLRSFGEGRHQRVDDRPFGGGPGMVLAPGPMVRAIESVRSPEARVIYLSPQGRRLDAQVAQRLAREQHLVIVCGHYEGLDQRVIGPHVDEELSIGDYVLTQGCLPALVVIDAVARFIPGVLAEGAVEAESFEKGRLEGPHYTRPVNFEGREVPPVLRQGDHAAIEQWRRREGVRKTAMQRPDLLADYLAEARLATGIQAGVALWVTDVGRSLKFYKRVLGWKGESFSEGRAVIHAPQLGVVLVEGIDGGSPNHLWIVTENSVVERVVRSQWPHQMKMTDQKRIEICDPDGHLWSIGLS